ncbi:hypothetical protein JW960_08360 [candidate division KSB1 bacterium]|nr:hypothetical protein [candidate division KSB1 bacterium]
MIRTSIIKSLAKVRRSKRLIFWYYLWNLGFGILIAFPLYIFLNDQVGKSLLGESLAQQFDMRVLFELLYYKSSMPAMLRSSLLVFLPMFIIIKLWFSGGTFSYLLNNTEFSFRTFINDSTRFLVRFLRLFIWSIPAFVVVFSIAIGYTLLTKLALGDLPDERLIFWNRIVTIALFFGCAMLCNLIFDYARMHIVANDMSNMWIAMWRGFTLALRHIGKTVSLYIVIALLGLGVLVIFLGLSLLLTSSHAVIIALMFLLHQIYIISRQFIYLLRIGSQAHLFRGLATEAGIRQSVYGYSTVIDTV